MNSRDSQIRWLVTTVVALTAALALTAPAGAWMVDSDGGHAGSGQESVPAQPSRSGQVDGSIRPAESFLRHARSEQQAQTSVPDAGVVVSPMNPGLVRSNGKTFVPGVDEKGNSTLVQVGPGLRAAAPFIPGYTDSWSGVAAKLGKDFAPVVPTATALGSSDDGVELGPLSIALALSLAVAALMALTALTVRRRRHVLLH